MASGNNCYYILLHSQNSYSFSNDVPLFDMHAANLYWNIDRWSILSFLL